MNTLFNTALLSSCLALLTACNDNGDISASSQSAQLTFAISDSPQDVQEVVIAFKSVAVKRVDDFSETSEDQAEQQIAVQDNNGNNTAYRQIDLLQFQGENAAELFTDIELEPGDYQMCIYITEGTENQAPDESYIVDNEGITVGLRTPSNGSCAGFKPDHRQNTGRLKTATFTLHEGKNYLVAEFDLMKVLKEPVGNKNYWTLKPSGYELIEADDAGSIEGQVNTDVINDCLSQNESSEIISTVYLYPGRIEKANMGDFRGDSAQDAGKIAPIACARINDRLENGPLSEYEFGFVRVGLYSIGYTCTYDDNAKDDPLLIYQNASAVGIEVIAGETVSAAQISLSAETP